MKNKGLKFEIQNFKSINEKITVNVDSKGRVCSGDKLHKTNKILAFKHITSMILNKYKIILSTDYIPTDLCRYNESQNIIFSIEIPIDGREYLYTVEHSTSSIIQEQLFLIKGHDHTLLFSSGISTINTNEEAFKEGACANKLGFGKGINRLFLWACDQDSGAISGSILSYINKFKIFNIKHEIYFYAIRDYKSLLSGLKCHIPNLIDIHLKNGFVEYMVNSNRYIVSFNDESERTIGLIKSKAFINSLADDEVAIIDDKDYYFTLKGR